MRIQLASSSWKFEESITECFIQHIIKDNKDLFTGNGGDTKNFIDKCKIAHARRVFTLDSTAGVKKRRKERLKKSTSPSPSASPQLVVN